MLGDIQDITLPSASASLFVMALVPETNIRGW
jgi:hypothetical protein